MSPIKKIILLLLMQCSFFNPLICDFAEELEGFTDDKASLEKKDNDGPAPCSDTTNLEALTILVFGSPTASILSDCDIYQKTNEVNKRPITTLPIFNLYHLEHACQDLVLKFNLFGNVCTKEFYSNNHPHLRSYITINTPCIIDKLEKSLTTVDQVPLIKKISKLVGNIKLEERRVGIMTQIFKNYKHCSLEFDIPFFYQERNIRPTEAEEYNLKRELTPPGGDVDSKAIEKEFLQHVVSDKIGFGDMRIRLAFPFIHDSNFCAKLGMQTTLPTTFCLKKGLLGSDFRGDLNTPKINLKLISCLGNKALMEDEEAKEELIALLKPIGFDALDRFGAMVLDSPLGNHRHFTAGLFFESRIKIQEGVAIFSNLSYEYTFPHVEKRFFLKIKNLDLAKFEKDIADGNEEAATQDMKQLNQALVETLFPGLYKTDIFPKNSVQFTIGTNFRIREWDFNIGYDAWWQQKEKIGSICGIDPCKNLKVAKGQNIGSVQNKLFGSFGYNKIQKDYDWSLSLFGEYAIATKGIGKDFTIAGRFEINF
ncbi:MAG: hypothetical protein P4L22_01885 [Candidatus Babeliales bacterium]|nr:hypothetical protein [Candidatus Babeliales bacterium]